MYELIFNPKKINEQLFFTIDKLYKNENFNSEKYLKITDLQLTWLYQFSDSEEFNNIDDLYNLYIKNNISINKNKLKNAILLLLAYEKKIICFV